MGLLRNRNFAILLSGQWISTIGNNLFSIALPWYVYTLTNSKLALTLTGVAETMPALVRLVAGVWVDRWPKRTTMIVSDVIRGLLSSIVFVDVLLRGPLWTILLMVLALQVVGQFFQPASSALFPLLVDPDDIAGGSGLLQSSNAAAQLFGTVSGGALMGFLGAPILFMLDAVSFLASVVSLLFIRVKEPGANRLSETSVSSSTSELEASSTAGPAVRSVRTKVRLFLEDWMEGFLVIGKSRFLILVTFAFLAANFAFAPMDIALTAWVKGPMHGVPLDLGILNGGFFVGIILGGICAGFISKRIPLRTLLLLGLVGVGASVGALGLFHGVVPETALAVVAGYAIGNINGSLNAMFIQIIPESMRGRAFGILGGLSAFAMPLGIALFGWLMIHVSLQLVFMLIGALCGGSGLLFLLPIRDDQVKAQETVRAEVLTPDSHA